MKFPDNAGDKFEVIMQGEDKSLKTATASLLENTLFKNYISKSDFGKWLAKFEYELEQAFLHNINVKATPDASHYKITVRY